MSLDSIRPWRQISRRKSREINVGKVKIGGDNPISVQTMTNTITADANKTIAQINSCAEAGAEIVRVSCPDPESTKLVVRPEPPAHAMTGRAVDA